MSERIINIHEAKTHLSRLLQEVSEGEEIILARAGRPCARLVPYYPPTERKLGFVQGYVDEAFFEDLPEAELKAWE